MNDLSFYAGYEPRLLPFAALLGIRPEQLVLSSAGVTAQYDQGEEILLFAFPEGTVVNANVLIDHVPLPAGEALLEFVQRMSNYERFADRTAVKLVKAHAASSSDSHAIMRSLAEQRATAVIFLAGLLGISEQDAHDIILKAPPQQPLRNILEQVADKYTGVLYNVREDLLRDYNEAVHLFRQATAPQAEASGGG